MADKGNITKITLPNGDIVHLKDSVSGYTTNTGTITSVKTTAGTHSTINVTSGAANFNVPTKTSHLTNDSNFATTSYVDTAIQNLPEPMIFKGSLGTGGTITELPTAAASNEGFTYKVITAGTYASQAAKVGDTFISDGSAWVLIPSGDEPSGTVTSVGVSNATNGGLSVSGSPVTSSGTITIGHTNVLTSAQTTQALYPIKIDKNGHISAYGSAVSIPTSAASHETGITATTTATKTTLGTAISVPNVTSVGSASTWTFEEKTIPNVTSAGSASSWTFEEKSIPNVTAAGSGSFTSGAFSGGSGSASLTFVMDTTDTKQLNISFSHTHNPATHGADSHTHTAPTLGTAIKVQSKSGGSNGSAPTLGTAIKVQSKSGGGNGSAPTLGTAISVPNVTGNTSATVTITDNGHVHTLS